MMVPRDVLAARISSIDNIHVLLVHALIASRTQEPRSQVVLLAERTDGTVIQERLESIETITAESVIRPVNNLILKDMIVTMMMPGLEEETTLVAEMIRHQAIMIIRVLEAAVLLR